MKLFRIVAFHLNIYIHLLVLIIIIIRLCHLVLIKYTLYMSAIWNCWSERECLIGMPDVADNTS